jgi:LacI family transcriptional regulator
MANSRITIADIAAKVGVSPSTVSRVLNGYTDVSEATREKILAVVNELGFVPNRHARRLRTQRTDSISIILPRIDAEFYPRVVTAIDAALEKHHYTSGLYPLLSETRLKQFQNESAPPYNADGLIYVSLNPNRLYKEGIPVSLPIVLLECENDEYDSVTLDNFFGGYLAGRHLCEVPADTFVVMVEERFSTPFASGVFRERLNGFRKALEEAGQPLPDDHIITMEFSWGGGRLAAQKIIKKMKGPVNIFATCDLMARGVLDEARLAGLEIGRDIRVIGYDDLYWVRDIGLTTIRQPIEEMGRWAVELLLERIKNPSLKPRKIKLTPELVRRTYYSHEKKN